MQSPKKKRKFQLSPGKYLTEFGTIADETGTSVPGDPLNDAVMSHQTILARTGDQGTVDQALNDPDILEKALNQTAMPWQPANSRKKN